MRRNCRAAQCIALSHAIYAGQVSPGDLTYQQAHKYERGINRVSAGRLFEVAQVLSVPVNYFFDGLDQENERAISPRERMCLELARNFAQIPNERHQEALSQLARVLATDD